MANIKKYCDAHFMDIIGIAALAGVFFTLVFIGGLEFSSIPVVRVGLVGLMVSFLTMTFI